MIITDNYMEIAFSFMSCLKLKGQEEPCMLHAGSYLCNYNIIPSMVVCSPSDIVAVFDLSQLHYRLILS